MSPQQNGTQGAGSILRNGHVTRDSTDRGRRHGSGGHSFHNHSQDSGTTHRPEETSLNGMKPEGNHRKGNSSNPHPVQPYHGTLPHGPHPSNAAAESNTHRTSFQNQPNRGLAERNFDADLEDHSQYKSDLQRQSARFFHTSAGPEPRRTFVRSMSVHSAQGYGNSVVRTERSKSISDAVVGGSLKHRRDASKDDTTPSRFSFHDMKPSKQTTGSRHSPQMPFSTFHPTKPLEVNVSKGDNARTIQRASFTLGSAGGTEHGDGDAGALVSNSKDLKHAKQAEPSNISQRRKDLILLEQIDPGNARSKKPQLSLPTAETGWGSAQNDVEFQPALSVDRDSVKMRTAIVKQLDVDRNMNDADSTTFSSVTDDHRPTLLSEDTNGNCPSAADETIPNERNDLKLAIQSDGEKRKEHGKRVKPEIPDSTKGRSGTGKLMGFQKLRSFLKKRGKILKKSKKLFVILHFGWEKCHIIM